MKDTELPSLAELGKDLLAISRRDIAISLCFARWFALSYFGRSLCAIITFSQLLPSWVSCSSRNLSYDLCNQNQRSPPHRVGKNIATRWRISRAVSNLSCRRNSRRFAPGNG